MKYRVEWTDEARAEVAAEYLNRQEQVAIINACYQRDRALESDPFGNGTPLSEGMFYIDRSPLRAIYSINSEIKSGSVGPDSTNHLIISVG